MEIRPSLNHESDTPLYRQLGLYLRQLIEDGDLVTGERLPPTRELAGQLGLNRTTVSAAYDLLETEGLIRGEVGRGSYVSALAQRPSEPLDWSHALTPSMPRTSGAAENVTISFTSSRPAQKLFPLEAFRNCCQQVLQSRELTSLMQLGSPRGYEPLRRYLLDRARTLGTARDTDDILITNGCQQALDLLRRALIRPGDKVAVEEPVYPGVRNLFRESGAELIGIPVGVNGLDLDALGRAFDAGAKAAVVTPSFQNPTGATIPAELRQRIQAMANAAGAIVIENDIYSDLACSGSVPPRLKQLDTNVILLGSFSKIAFPGMRVGWVIAPRPVIARVTELKELSDLHTDHLSQAFLLRFAESGELEKHHHHVLAATREKLKAVEQSCRRFLTGCRWNMPSGGMNIWIELPRGLDAVSLRGLAQQAGVDYLPGRYFSVSRSLDSGLRLSFAGLEPSEIRKGIEILGGLIRVATESRDERASKPELALV